MNMNNNLKTLKKTTLGLLLTAAMSVPAFAQVAPQPQNVVGLQANATREVTKDLLSVTLSTTREGADAAAVQAGLKQALDAALKEAKKSAKPGEIDVSTGNFSIFPKYTNKGVISGWSGTAELVVEGKDIPGIAQLTGRITTLSIARVQSGLSRESREKVENEVAAQAIAAYRAKAAEYAKQFGFTGYTLREVQVNANDFGGPVPMMMKASRGAADAAESLPVELGKGNVTVNVNGTVQLTK
jgi:predicted secreted protein